MHKKPFGDSMFKLVFILFSTFCIWNYSFSSELATSIDNEPIDVMGSYEEKPVLNNKKQIDLETPSEEIIIDTKVSVQEKKIAPAQRYAPKKVSRSDKMKKARRQLELRNEMMVKKQIEELRLRQEIAMMKKLEEAFDKSMEKLDNLQ
jgi:hypothetical protein